MYSKYNSIFQITQFSCYRMAEDGERHSGRASSPYHKKCFPPYCDNGKIVD